MRRILHESNRVSFCTKGFNLICSNKIICRNLNPVGSYTSLGGSCIPRVPAQSLSNYVQSRFRSDTIKVTFFDADGSEETVDANLDTSFLDVAQENDIEVEGACGGEMACSTCHLIFDKQTYDSLPEKEEEEEDMLDLALGLTETSRLGCQVYTTKAMDGIRVQLPKEVSNQSS